MAKLLQLELPFSRAPRPAVTAHQIVLGGEVLSYRIKRSRRRSSIVILVDEDGIRVGAPWRASERSITRVLVDNSAWLLKTAREWQQKRAPRLEWCDGEQLFFQGEPIVLRIVPHAQVPMLSDGELRIGVPGFAVGEAIEAQVKAFLRARALELFAQRAGEHSQRLEIAAPAVLLSNARTRWGSCNASGRVRLNWRLVQMPHELIDYVVAHEIAHLLHMNHSRRFWATVARLRPDYTEARARLKHEGYRYLRV